MQERLKTKSLQISVFRLDPRRSLTSPSAVISNRFTDRNKIDRTLLPCKKFWLGAAAVSYLTMSVGSVLIWFPSDNNKKRKESSNIVQRLTAAERSGMFLMWHWGILRSRTTGAEGEAVCSFGQRDFFFFGLLGVAALTPAGTLAALGRLCGTPWCGSAGTASRTSWWEPSVRLEHRTKTTMSGGRKAEQKFKWQCLFQLCNTFFLNATAPPCVHRGFLQSFAAVLWNPFGKEGCLTRFTVRHHHPQLVFCCR